MPRKRYDKSSVLDVVHYTHLMLGEPEPLLPDNIPTPPDDAPTPQAPEPEPALAVESAPEPESPAAVEQPKKED
jgi:hypothetical protein